MPGLNRNTICRLLGEIKLVAADSSLTGSLSRGAHVLVDVYNKCLNALEELGDPDVKSLFPKLVPGTAGMDEVGAAAALLRRYVSAATGEEDEDDEFGENGDEDDEEDEHWNDDEEDDDDER